MTLFFFILFFTLINTYTVHAQYSQSIQSIQEHSAIFKKHITHSNPQEILYIVQIVHSLYSLLADNTKLLITKLQLEEKIAQLETISVTGDWHNILNIKHNDIESLQTDITLLKKQHETLEKTIASCSQTLPLIASINPSLIETFMHAVKQIFITWGIEQNITQHNKDLLSSLNTATTQFNHLHSAAFQDITKHTRVYLQNIINAHQSVDTCTQQIAQLRKQYLQSFELLFYQFFKSYYTISHNKASEYILQFTPQQLHAFNTLPSPQFLFP